MKNKTLAAVTAFALAFVMLAPLALAADEYLPDVENLTAEALPSSVKLAWDTVEGADSYTIYYGVQSISEDGAMYENDVLVGNVAEYTIEDLTVGTLYYFSVAADDSTGVYLGSYNYSEEVSATPLASVEPVDPVIPEDPVVPEDPAIPLDTVDPVDIIDPLDLVTPPTEMDTFLGEDHSTANNTPESLPQSGPATAAVVLVSTAGAYFWRKFRR